MLGLIRLEYGRYFGDSALERRESLRHELGCQLLLGLEVLVAADVVHTVLAPSLHELAVLGGIVAILTAIRACSTLNLFTGIPFCSFPGEEERC